jgi:hypothetical protein
VFVAQGGPTTPTPNCIGCSLLKRLLKIVLEKNRLSEPIEIKDLLWSRTTPNSNQKHSLPHLWDTVVATLDDLMTYTVSRIFHTLADSLERVSFVMGNESGYIFEDNVLGLVMLDPLHELEEQSTPSIVKSTMVSSI